MTQSSFVDKFALVFALGEGVLHYPIIRECAPVLGGFLRENCGNGLKQNLGMGCNFLLEIMGMPRFGILNNLLVL